jgi:hypothetical protein
LNNKSFEAYTSKLTHPKSMIRNSKPKNRRKKLKKKYFKSFKAKAKLRNSPNKDQVSEDETYKIKKKKIIKSLKKLF